MSCGFHRQLCAIPFLAILVSLLCALPARSAEKQPTSKNVLVLFSGIGTDDKFLNLIEPVIRSRVREPITFYDAYLVHGHDEETEKLSLGSEAETFRRTYAGVKLDVVIAISAPAMISDLPGLVRRSVFALVTPCVRRPTLRAIELC